jgi:hypothetical protein
VPKKNQFKKTATKDSIRQRKFNSSDEQKKRRAERNSSRAKMVQAGKARKGDGKDVDHRDHNTGNKSAGNLSIMSRSANRAKNQYDKRKRK